MRSKQYPYEINVIRKIQEKTWSKSTPVALAAVLQLDLRA